MGKHARVPFAPGFPTDWPVRPANLLQLDWQAHTRNLINIWLPEGVHADGGRVLFILSEEVSFEFARPSADEWVLTFTKPGAVALRGACRNMQDGVALSLELTNLSDRVWENVRGGVCVQLAAAPDFVDLALERTFIVADGALAAAPQPAIRKGPTHHYHPLALPTENFIAVASRPAGYVVAQWWEGDPGGVGGNCHPSMACIHAPPAFGRLAPGESATRAGRLYMMPGSPQDAYERFLGETGR